MDTLCIEYAGGVFMCRRNHLRGCLLLGIGIGLVIGHHLGSWFLCTCGGTGLAVLGLLTLCHR